MATGKDSDLGSLLLWAGVAYAAYSIYQASQSDSGSLPLVSTTPGQFDASGTIAAPTTGTLNSAPGGSNPGGVSSTDLSNLFSGTQVSFAPAPMTNASEAGPAGTPGGGSGNSGYSDAQNAYYAQMTQIDTDAGIIRPDPAQAAQAAAQSLQQEQAYAAANPNEGAPWTAQQSQAFSNCTYITGAPIPGAC